MSNEKSAVKNIPQLFPEIIDAIFKTLRDDHRTLFNCLRVNRTWARLTVPILWADPFQKCSPNKSQVNLINTYLLFPDMDEKDQLLRNFEKLRASLLQCSPPLFDYATFIKEIDVAKIDKAIRNWLESHHEN